MRLDIYRVLLEHVQQLMHQAQEILIVLFFPFRSFENRRNVADRVLDGRQIVGRQESTQRCAPDHHALERKSMSDNFHFAAGQKVATKYHGNRHQHPYNCIHCSTPLKQSQYG